jgi:serine/threonine protein kinase
MDAAGQRDLRGQMVVAAWAWIPELEMGIGGSMPVAAVLAPVAPVRTAFNVLLGVFAVLTAGLFGSTRFLRIRRRTAQDSPFGAYVVERSVGKGGMAEVFLARHAFLRRPAALKILSQQNPDAAAVDRFEREARLASRLAHPNTIQVFDFGETPDGRLYYAMEFVEGVTLAQFLTLGGPPPVGRAVSLLRQVAGSLREAHQLGLLHRDLKPSNIMLTARGGLADIVKVLDFGIACSLTPGSDDFTRTTALVGTPAFLAPERIRSPQTLDPRSDLYAFGAVAFYLLTGRHVFEGTSATELLYQVMTAPRPSPSQLRGEKLPDALEKLILDCLCVDPEGRPSGVQEIEAALESLAGVERWTQEQALEWWASNQDKMASFVHATR